MNLPVIPLSTILSIAQILIVAFSILLFYLIVRGARSFKGKIDLKNRTFDWHLELEEKEEPIKEPETETEDKPKTDVE